MSGPHDPGSAPLESTPLGPHIRRQPTGPLPRAEDAQTHLIRRVPRQRPLSEPPTAPAKTGEPAGEPTGEPSGRAAVAAAATGILSGWPTAVLATDLISGWWATDRLFCLALGFLTVVFAGATVSGVILLLLRRNSGRYLVAFGAALALLTFGAVFVAGATVAWPVYLIPALPLACLTLTLQPATGRWCAGDR